MKHNAYHGLLRQHLWTLTFCTVFIAGAKSNTAI